MIILKIEISNGGNKNINKYENSNINPLLRSIVKWSDTLQKSYSICCKIFKVCLTILRHCEVKG